ncbi:MAG: hypothetical protein R2932_17290 [Caldilineaceae bacterium]
MRQPAILREYGLNIIDMQSEVGQARRLRCATRTDQRVDRTLYRNFDCGLSARKSPTPWPPSSKNSQAARYQSMRALPGMAAKAHRWVGEDGRDRAQTFGMSG